MKKLIILIILLAVYGNSFGQQGIGAPAVNSTFSPSNATFHNNSQFYNKDNVIDASKAQPVSNADYWVPGYSNPANSTPDSRIPSSTERLRNITIMGYENVQLNKNYQQPSNNTK